jgi:hypothetical protein
MKQDPQIMAICLSDSELICYVPSVLSALAQQLDSRQDTLNSHDDFAG